ncbi:hypothetical protein VTN31DRAFT_2880 [Thermomyces dupontii]|uniref:uncharacterized protein n=1 Tax=Talaromyces thermophilus TaxID=28565 RepID=UPI003742D6E9
MPPKGRGRSARGRSTARGQSTNPESETTRGRSKKKTDPEERLPIGLRGEIEQVDDPSEDDCVDFTELEDPQPDWEPNFLTNIKTINAYTSKKLIEFEMWGFKNYGETRRAGDRLRILRKLYYNQAEQHQIVDLEDMLTLKRDAGPRLLKRDKGFRVLPISRRYPDLPSNEALFEEQFSKPSKFQEQDLKTPSQLDDDQPSKTAEGPSEDPVDGRKMNTEQPSTNDELNRYLVVKENIEKAILNAGYWQLAIHRSISDGNSSDGDGSSLLAHRIRGWVQLMRHPGDLFLFPTRGEDGLAYLSRGHGPQLDACETSSLGCLVIVGKFLDAGITRIDHARAETERDRITDPYRLFVRLVRTEWPAETPEKGFPNLANLGKLLQSSRNVTDAWNKCTFLCGQFTMHVKSIKTCVNGHREEEVIQQNTLNIADTQTAADLSMEDVINQGLRRVNNAGAGRCKICSQRIREHDSRLTKPPLRLAIALQDPDLSPRNHTADSLSIKYEDDFGKEQTAVYRWLGGIYSNIPEKGRWMDNDNRFYGIDGAYRVYWTETVRGEHVSKNVRIYDPTNPMGMIVGDLVPLEDEPIPQVWWKNTHKPLLFYERVLVPTILDLQVAAATIGDVMHAMKEKKDDAQWVHRTWAARQPFFFPRQRDGPSTDEPFSVDPAKYPLNPDFNNIPDSGNDMLGAQLQGDDNNHATFDDAPNQIHNTENQPFTDIDDIAGPTLLAELAQADGLTRWEDLLSHLQFAPQPLDQPEIEINTRTTTQQNQTTQAAPRPMSPANPTNPGSAPYVDPQTNMTTAQQGQGSSTTIDSGHGQFSQYPASGTAGRTRSQTQNDINQQVQGAPLSLPGQPATMPSNGQSGQAQQAQQQNVQHSQFALLDDVQLDQVIQQLNLDYFGYDGDPEQQGEPQPAHFQYALFESDYDDLFEDQNQGQDGLDADYDGYQF